MIFKHNLQSLILLFSIINSIAFCQLSPHDDWYNKGVTCFDKEEFFKADSLFTYSITRYPDKDNYFYRAKCKGKQSDKKGYCSDLAYACYYENFEAEKLFLKSCGRLDTVVTNLNSSSRLYELKQRVVSIYCNDSSVKLVKINKIASQFYSKAVIDSIKLFDSLNTSSIVKEENSEFVGGLKAMMEFIIKNLKLPKNFNSESNGKVFLKFAIFEDGSIQDITLLKGISNCEACNAEAQRVVAIMPKWKPAKINGRRVKCYFNLPISFRA